MTSDLVRFTQDFVSAWNDHDLHRILTFYSEEYCGEDVGRATPILGHRGVEQVFNKVLHAFPDLSISNQELIIQANRLAIVWKMQGTQQGGVMNIPPTGRRVSVQGCSIFSIEDGKIFRGIHIWDVAGLLRTIGLLPDL